MKKIALLLLLLAVAGCDTSKITPEAVASGVAKTCDVVVPVADIATVLLHEPTSATVDAVIRAICGAIDQQKSAAKAGTKSETAPTTGTVVVNGVDVHWTSK